MRYSPTVLDHFLNPRNTGLMREPDGVGEDEYEGCGDLARFFLRVTGGRASELLAGRAVEDLVNVKSEEIERALDGLPDDRKHAADVVAGAVRAAALDHLRRRSGHV